MFHRLSAKWVLPLALVFLPLSAFGCEYFESPAGITKVVMAQQVQGANFEPVGISDNYPPDQSEFHVVVTLTNAPKDSVVKAVWFAVDVGSASPPDTKIDETEVKVEGSRNIDFTLPRSGKQWPSGLYKVQIYWNGKLDRTLNFVVTGTPQRTGTVTGGCPPATTQPHKLSGWVSKVIMAERTTGEAKEPVNPTGEFYRNETIHAVVTIKEAPPNTKFRAVFFAVDAGDSTLCNVRLGESEFVTGGSRNIDFALPPGKDWALGKYRVDIYVNEALDHTANYVVVRQKSVH